MATLTKLDSTPHGIRYQLDGAAGGVTKTQAQLIADLSAGSLKAMLQRISTDAEWTALTNDLRFVFVSNTIQTVGADLVTAIWSVSGGRNLAFAFAQTGNAYLVDLRFLPTPVI